MQQIEMYLAENGVLVISRIVGFGMLVSLAVMDLRTRMVPSCILLAGSVLAPIYAVISKENPVSLMLGGLMVGLFFVLISKVTREGLGYGDSWVICILGVYLGTWRLLELLFAAWFAAAAAAMFLIAKKGYRRGMGIPMMPFLAMGYAVVWGAEIYAL